MSHANSTVWVEKLSSDWRFRQAGKSDWHPARVPGCVQTDLMENGLIDDPFFRDNEKSVQWIDKENWEYMCQFQMNSELLRSEHIALVFEGLDTYATVYLNGTKIIEADNMFFPWQADVKPLLREKQNEILITFRSPIVEILPGLKTRRWVHPAPNDPEVGTSPYTRKAPYHFGWDWGPRLVTMGIWQPVKLVGWDGFRIEGLHFITKRLDRVRAHLEIQLDVISDIEGPAILKINDDKRSFGLKYPVTLHMGRNRISSDVEFANPRLWWPGGYGKQPLYTVRVEIESNGKVAGEEKRIGLRTLELRRHSDNFGQSFVFVVNSVPIFAKGANWIPADSFTHRVTEDRYRHLLTSAAEANMNMLRVWGGGIYESDTFYNLCDELGILVWQDFLFACSMYPAHAEFVQSVRTEATYQVQRLRHHPCIAIWCGNNEIEGTWQDSDWNEKYPESFWNEYLRLFAEALPAVCQNEDPSRPYWSSSPGSDERPTEFAQNPMQGDTHYWGVWHNQEPFDFYRHHAPRFISEYGFQSFPELNTIEKFTHEADRDIFSPVMLNHQKNRNGNSLIKEYMANYYGVPEKFEDFVLLSQVQQAEAIKTGAEHFRRIRPRCMGSLYWQLNDCWPVASWSSIDYYGAWKALHYVARRFYAPILAVPADEDMAYQVYVVSDEPRMNRATLSVSLMDFTGNVLFQREKEIAINPLSSALALSIIKNNLPVEIDPAAMFFHCSLKKEQQVISENYLFFTTPARLRLLQSTPEVRFSTDETGIDISLKSSVFVHTLILQANGAEGFFEDNFFHVVPGQEKSVRFRPRTDAGREQFQASFNCRSLLDLLATAPAAADL
ncbi:MAG: beta-mannosidase [Candidatus Zhuqueibacterota bacterium]